MVSTLNTFRRAAMVSNFSYKTSNNLSCHAPGIAVRITLDEAAIPKKHVSIISLDQGIAQAYQDFLKGFNERTVA